MAPILALYHVRSLNTSKMNVFQMISFAGARRVILNLIISFVFRFQISLIERRSFSARCSGRRSYEVTSATNVFSPRKSLTLLLLRERELSLLSLSFSLPLLPNVDVLQEISTEKRRECCDAKCCQDTSLGSFARLSPCALDHVTLLSHDFHYTETVVEGNLEQTW